MSLEDPVIFTCAVSGALAALTLGGSIRVGLEDNLHLPEGTMARETLGIAARPAAAAPPGKVRA